MKIHCVKTNPWLYKQHMRILTYHFDEKSLYCRPHDSESLDEDLLLHDCAAQLTAVWMVFHCIPEMITIVI